ncbi:PAS domain S-box protein [Methanoplanus sp. FWC-SCC4]|uniref:histidine kinase n=1 Tax=Methanochimaera problematica TaxID=2609417 RepID=A0AA97FFU1_9EURY|nr:PAS domain S-box protein [Methanoplanus sp. FWC-SCC4]WOF16671.1 PAS domain S-box protein [Methanoplanus sp. FWC-SCC4]
MIKILHVDDEPALLEITRIFLEKESEYSVKNANSAIEGISLLKSEPFDAIISDFEMPGMNGIEFLKEIRALGFSTPFIIFSGRGREDVLIEAINNGADFYLQKGGKPKAQFAEMKNMIVQAVKRKQAEKALRESEERYRAVVESQTEFVCRFAPSGIINFANEAFCRNYNVESSSIIGRSLKTKIPRSDRKRLEVNLRLLRPNNPVLDIEHRVIMPDGEVRWQHWIDRAIFDENGNIVEYQAVGRDTTIQKRMQKSLKEEINYVQALMNTIAAPVFFRDTKGVYYDCNLAFEEFVGYSRDEIIGKNIYDFFEKDLADVYAKKDEEIVKNPHVQRYEFCANNSKGEKKDVIFSKTARFAEDGTVSGIVGIIIDISDRKKIENNLIKEVNFVQALKDTIPAPVFYRDRYGIYYDCNVAFEELVGLSKDEIIGKNIHDFFEKDLADVYTKKDLEIINNPHLQQYEYTINNAKGERIDVLFSKTALFGADGNVLGIVGVILDISNRKKMEEALRKNEEKFRTLADYTYDLESWIGPDKNIVYISPSCERITGFKPDEFTKNGIRVIKNLIHPDDLESFIRHYESFSEEMTDVVHFDFRIIRPDDGKLKWLSHYCQPVYDSSGKWLGRRETCRDITLRKEYEDKVSEVNEKLNLLSSVTRHDVLNQVTALLGYFELSREMAADNPQAAMMVGKMEVIASTIQHQITFTKDYQEIGVHSPAWQNLSETVWYSAYMVSQGDVLVDVSIDEKIEIYADPLLNKVFYNFIDNSIRHGGEKLSQINIFSEMSDDLLKIIYTDDGQGISCHDKDKILLKGFGKNTGYGLFLTSNVLAMTGMNINECGVPGEGVRFEITVPGGMYRIK